MQAKNDKAATITVDAKKVLATCDIAINQLKSIFTQITLPTIKTITNPKNAVLDLIGIKEPPKPSDVAQQLSDKNKEILIAQLINLGEALTFCRDRNNPTLIEVGIVGLARQLAEIRNDLVHHYMYSENQNEMLNKHIATVREKIVVLEKAIGQLKQKENLTILSKPTSSPQNEFAFPFTKHLNTLQAEMTQVEKLIESGEEIGLANHIRNTYTIMLDLVADHNSYQMAGGKSYQREDCKAEKETARAFNDQFATLNENLAAFFYILRERRNNLAHVMNMSTPYNSGDLIEFAKEIESIKKYGYVTQLEKGLQILKEKKQSYSDEKVGEEGYKAASEPYKKQKTDESITQSVFFKEQLLGIKKEVASKDEEKQEKGAKILFGLSGYESD